MYFQKLDVKTVIFRSAEMSATLGGVVVGRGWGVQGKRSCSYNYSSTSASVIHGIEND